jgi:hypothetical protein
MGLMDWLYPNSKSTTPVPIAVPAREEMAMFMKGVWSRKQVEFADLSAVNAARLVISNHPWSIANTPELAASYAAIYGADELTTLKASCAGSKFNMVQSPTQKWCLGGVWLAPDPPASDILQPGMEWQVWGTERRQVPIGAVSKAQPATVSELSVEVKAELAALVYGAVTDALEAWASRPQSQ